MVKYLDNKGNVTESGSRVQDMRSWRKGQENDIDTKQREETNEKRNKIER